MFLRDVTAGRTARALQSPPLPGPSPGAWVAARGGPGCGGAAAASDLLIELHPVACMLGDMLYSIRSTAHALHSQRTHDRPDFPGDLAWRNPPSRRSL